MARQLFLEIVDLNRTLDRISYSKTLQGKWFNFLGCKCFYYYYLIFFTKFLTIFKIFFHYIVLGKYLLYKQEISSYYIKYILIFSI